MIGNYKKTTSYYVVHISTIRQTSLLTLLFPTTMRKLLTWKNLFLVLFLFITVDVVIYFLFIRTPITRWDRIDPVETVSNPAALVSIYKAWAERPTWSWFYITQTWWFLTARHVVAWDNNELKRLLTIDNNPNIILEQVHMHPVQDIALVKTSQSFSACIPIESSYMHLGEHQTLIKLLDSEIVSWMSWSPLFAHNFSAIWVLIAKHLNDPFQWKYELLTHDTLDRLLDLIGDEEVCA